jgi:hypothetical protein
VNERFLPLPADAPDCRHLRGLMMAVAQELFIVLPDGAPQKTAAIDHLVVVADLACAALVSS